MAGAAGHTGGHLSPALEFEQALRDSPAEFELFEALRLLERAHPGRPRLGRSSRAAEDPVRLRQTPSLAFAPCEIDGYRPGDAARPGQLHTLSLGLFGANGPLPLHLTEYAIERRLNAKDGTLAAFADIFHHRMLSLFYRAWADAQPTVQADRPGEDRFRGYIAALAGVDSDAVPGAHFHAGRLLSPARNAEGLRAMAAQAFGVPVRVLEFVAGWMELPRASWLRLGRGRDVAALGRTTVMGSLVRGCQQRFRLRVGPLDHAAFQRFLPGGETLRQLTALVRTCVGDEGAWDLQLVLDAGQVPTTRLGMAGRMGLDTWLGQRSWDLDDADDVVVQPATRSVLRGSKRHG